MASSREVVEFARDQPADILSRMATLATERNGWINLQPEVVDEETAPADGLFGVFSGRGPEVPLCTWTPGELSRRGPKPPSIGVQHRTGPRAVARLAGLGHDVPSNWLVVQDHPRRGLVVLVAPDEAHERVLAWLMDTGEALCPLRVTGRWTASVFVTRR